MDLLEKNFPESDHVLIFDNAPTHLKRADDSLSARKMPKGIKYWGVEKSVTGPDGKVTKEKV
ncbi:hypothetical protein M405DRAFT_891108, partial [Rhizopogon salebrosus TDB-379]